MPEPTWKHSDVFPIIARLIGELYEKSHRHVTAHEIAVRLLDDPEARAVIDTARQQQQDWSPEHTASNMVAWFSQRITVRESEWERSFERERIDGQWAYKPVGAVL